MQKQLKNALIKYNIAISDDEIEKLCEFVEMMKEYNKTHNITAITDDNDIIYKHIVDSLLPVEIIENLNTDLNTNTQNTRVKVLDIGCGGGFPSIPLSVASNKLQITAIDSVKKKTDFVELVKNQLKLNNINVLTTRVEDFASKQDFREKYDVVVSRAVAPLNVILEYSAPMLHNGGYIIAYKGSNYKEELWNAKNALKVLDCDLKDTLEFTINEIDAKRYILKIQKNSTISTKYPRKQNKPRLQPL